jgi:hypothetical protein
MAAASRTRTPVAPPFINQYATRPSLGSTVSHQALHLPVLPISVLDVSTGVVPHLRIRRRLCKILHDTHFDSLIDSLIYDIECTGVSSLVFHSEVLPLILCSDRLGPTLASRRSPRKSPANDSPLLT